MRIFARHGRAPGAPDLAGERARLQAVLRAIVAEAVIWQDEAEAVLAEIRDRQPLAEVAPRGGPLISRFVALACRLPESSDPEIRRHTTILRMVFDHHALMLKSSMEMLAFDWRSERIVEQIEKIDGLGAPASWLEAVRDELREHDDAHACDRTPPT
jgi:hypothetical protein